MYCITLYSRYSHWQRCDMDQWNSLKFLLCLTHSGHSWPASYHIITQPSIVQYTLQCILVCLKLIFPVGMLVATIVRPLEMRPWSGQIKLACLSKMNLVSTISVAQTHYSTRRTLAMWNTTAGYWAIAYRVTHEIRCRTHGWRMRIYNTPVGPVTSTCFSQCRSSSGWIAVVAKIRFYTIMS